MLTHLLIHQTGTPEWTLSSIAEPDLIGIYFDSEGDAYTYSEQAAIGERVIEQAKAAPLGTLQEFNGRRYFPVIYPVQKTP